MAFFDIFLTRILRDVGLDTVVNLPGVGENLQEQPNSNLIFEGTLNVTGYATYATFGNAEDLFGSEKVAISKDVSAKLAEYAEFAASGSRGGLNAYALEQIFRIQHNLIFNKNVTIGETITAFSAGYLLTAWWCLLPFSRGRVHLASLDGFDSPKIDPQYFVADIDIITQVAIGKQAQSFWYTSPIAGITARNLTADPASDEEWAKYITGTCQCPHAYAISFYINTVSSRTELSSHWYSLDDVQGTRWCGGLRVQGIRDEQRTCGRRVSAAVTGQRPLDSHSLRCGRKGFGDYQGFFCLVQDNCRAG